MACEVYRARDEKLQRDVALKVLPDSFAGDAERLARFRREAQTLAALNHPHIAQIHGLEEGPGGALTLVMELVDGEDLSARISRGPLPIDEALPIARQLVDALTAAHEAGVVHRDLKPANIKVRPDGTVKVLDFGLAKALDGPAASRSGGPTTQSPTITTPAMTMRGVILGTAAYMAPEQAKGYAVDRRADIWAFGAVLFEMLSGRRAFAGDDVGETLASVIKGTVDWVKLPATTPPRLRRLLEGCLTERQARPHRRHRRRAVRPGRDRRESGRRCASNRVAGDGCGGRPRRRRHRGWRDLGDATRGDAGRTADPRRGTGHSLGVHRRATLPGARRAAPGLSGGCGRWHRLVSNARSRDSGGKAEALTDGAGRFRELVASGSIFGEY